jgi:crotonobetainyl-CoA:carnitine CoA-transferase CaiB-like acyl-CoA transferase
MKPILEGYRVLDLSQLVAGPLAAASLVDLGADVIKVEPPSGDKCRMLGEARIAPDCGAAFLAMNRNKRSVVIDFKNEAGRAAFRTLIAKADVVISSNLPAVAARLGLSYDALRAINPKIIVCAIRGYGSQGPLKDVPAVDYAVQAETGMISINGTPEQAVKIGFTVIDVASGHLAATAVVAALLHRERTGEGQEVSVSLYDAAISLQTVLITEYLQTGVQPPRTGNSAVLGSPADLFATADCEVIISGYFPNQWLALCEILGRTDLASDARFLTNQARLRNRIVLYETLAVEFRKRTSESWITLLREAGVVIARVASYAEMLRTEQTRANSIIQEWTDGRLGALRTVGSPLRFSGIPEVKHASVPALGQHTNEVFAELCPQPLIEEWRSNGAFGRAINDEEIERV